MVTSGRREGIQALITPVHGSIADQSVTSTACHVISTAVEWEYAVRRSMLTIHTLQDSND